MPRRRSQSTKRAVALGTVAVLFGLALLVGLSVLSGRGDVDLSNLADRDFRVGRTDRLAEEIEERGPFLVADASPNRARDLYINHDGFRLDGGWVAILAGTRDCPVQWTGEEFRDCDGETFPPSGEGLTRYETRVEGRALYVDLRTEVE